MDNVLGWEEQVMVTQVGNCLGHQSGEDPMGTPKTGLKSQYSSCVCDPCAFSVLQHKSGADLFILIDTSLQNPMAQTCR